MERPTRFLRQKEQTGELPVSSQGRMIDLERTADLLGNIRAIWGQATLEEREVWFKLMSNKVYVHNGVIKAIEPTPVISALFDTRSGNDGIRTRVGYQSVIIVPYGAPFEEIQRLLTSKLRK